MYRIGDIVLVSSIDQLELKSLDELKAMLNAYGEELMVGNVMKL